MSQTMVDPQVMHHSALWTMADSTSREGLLSQKSRGILYTLTRGLQSLQKILLRSFGGQRRWWSELWGETCSEGQEKPGCFCSEGANPRKGVPHP
ncbi:unnamed protein product [Ixodes persulcatus]